MLRSMFRRDPSLPQQAEKNQGPIRTVVRERAHSGEEVTVESSLTVSGVIAIITLIAQDSASLPLILYGRAGRSKFRATDHPYYRLLHDAPNPEHTAMQFREYIVSHMIAWGNFYAQVIYDGAGVAKELWPLRPDKMTVKRVDGEKIYEYQMPSGKPRIFLRHEVLHIAAMGFDGLTGMSRIALARNAIGLGMSLEKYGSRVMRNDARPSVALRHPNRLVNGSDNTTYNRLKENWSEVYGGADNAGKPLILEEGMDITTIGFPPEDAQYLESRKFQLSEINRIIGPVPPHMIGDVSSSTSWGTGIDSQEQGYVNHTLRGYTTRIEQALVQQLLLEEDRAGGYFFEHLFDGLLRGDISTRYAAYVQAITNGWMSRNEVRLRENLNPRNGLDEILQPLNMTPVPNAGTDTSASQTDTAPTNALMPLWREALARSLRRESNDVLGASKRMQAKGQKQAWETWLENFYRHDQPAFMSKQLQPVLDAQERLTGVDLSEWIDARAFEFLAKRLDAVRDMSAEQVTAEFENYPERTVEWLVAEVDAMLDEQGDDYE